MPTCEVLHLNPLPSPEDISHIQ